ncbi:hypothetical protein B0H16DRAFT_1408608 [Mycena metata]|uniref:NAD(P)-binding protein n=1 Tax=Mycena metata TaxID=1033252 RepID=A0AAD7JXF6_9AGAR|nr:hypothetical protein B0H16DRAFT_1408608 [Mycena metata]
MPPPPPAFSFEGDVAIVSGAGSRLAGEIGNGRATAILLARQGAKVALLDYNVEWAQETKRMIDEEGGVSEVIQCDVTQEAQCESAVKKTVELFGAVHILINIVGVGGPHGNVTEVDLAAWDRDFRINVTSMVMMSRFAIPEMKKVGRGAIVNMCASVMLSAIAELCLMLKLADSTRSSVSGLMGGNPGVLYPVSKGAIIQLTRAMAAHHGPDNIRVNCVAPGMTPMVRGRGMTDEMRQRRIEQNLLRQEGTGWDVGYAILFLASREARWITGVIFPVDGGTTAGNPNRPALTEDTHAAAQKAAESLSSS